MAAGTLFVLPATVILALLSWLYLRFGDVPVVAGVVFGLQAAVLGIIAQAVHRIGAKVLRTPFAVALAMAALLAIALARWPFPLILPLAAMAGWGASRWRPGWLPVAGHCRGVPDRGAAEGGAVEGAAGGASASAQGAFDEGASGGWKRAAWVTAVCLALWWLPIGAIALALGTDSTAFGMGLFFSKAALVTVGGAYAVLPYVAEQAVTQHGWLSATQMLAGLGLAETTPGPLIMVLEFVGFVGGWQRPDLASPLASALLGAAVTVWATFLPSFLFVLTAAPWIERIARWRWAAAMLAGITAAVVGVIANLALWFGWRMLAGQPWSMVAVVAAIAVLAYLGLARWRWPVHAIVLVAAVTGAVARPLLV